MAKQEKPIVYWQSQCEVSSKNRGFHLITPRIMESMQSMPGISTGLLNIFLQHTSASLTISENTCKDVQLDLETFFNRIAPDDTSLYRHILEGEDDMPAHIKNALLGASLTIPISNSELLLGQWQGIYLCEHRNNAPTRRIILTAQGY